MESNPTTEKVKTEMEADLQVGVPEQAGTKGTKNPKGNSGAPQPLSTVHPGVKVSREFSNKASEEN